MHTNKQLSKETYKNTTKRDLQKRPTKRDLQNKPASRSACEYQGRVLIYQSEDSTESGIPPSRIPMPWSMVLLCCSVLQCVAVYCSVLQCVIWKRVDYHQVEHPCHDEWCWCVAVCCSVLQCVAVCCSVLQCYQSEDSTESGIPPSGTPMPGSMVLQYCSVLQCVTVCCSVLQCVAVCCSVLQCVAVCYSVWVEH